MKKNSVDIIRQMVDEKGKELWSAIEQARDRAYNAHERIRGFKVIAYYWAYSDLAKIAGISPEKVPGRELSAERVEAEIQKVKRKVNNQLKRIGEMGKDEAIKILLAIERVLAIGRDEDPWQAADTLEADLLAKGLL